MSIRRAVILLIGILCFGLAGCAGTTVQALAPTSQMNKAQGNGLVAITTVRYFHADLMYGNINKVVYGIHREDSKASQDQTSDPDYVIRDACRRGEDWFDPRDTPGTDHGCVTVFVLPPGDYVLTGVVTAGGGGLSANRTPYSFKFTVAEGRVTYFGSLLVDVPDLSSAHKTGSVAMIVRRSNEWKRDAPIAMHKYPNVDWNNVMLGGAQ